MKTIKLDEKAVKNVLNDLLKRSPNQYTEYEDGMYIMNPGAVMGYPSEYGVIDIQNGQILINTAVF